MKTHRKQQGVTVVEFSLISSTLLLLVFGILELGYFTFNLQALNDLTRKAARIATVCQVSDGDVIKSLALSETDLVPKGFTSTNLDIDYLNSSGQKVDNIFAANAPIQYVRAKVVGYNYGFSGLLNFLGENGVVSIPPFETILAAESLGVGRIDPETGSDVYIDCK